MRESKIKMVQVHRIIKQILFNRILFIRFRGILNLLTVQFWTIKWVQKELFHLTSFERVVIISSQTHSTHLPTQKFSPPQHNGLHKNYKFRIKWKCNNGPFSIDSELFFYLFQKVLSQGFIFIIPTKEKKNLNSTEEII